MLDRVAKVYFLVKKVWRFRVVHGQIRGCEVVVAKNAVVRRS